jgi:hypothetical protein
VATPFFEDFCNCHALGGDTYEDLNLKFRISEIASALELGSLGGETVRLYATGTLTTNGAFAGEVIHGSDCVLVLTGHWGDAVPGIAVGFLTRVRRGDDGQLGFSFYTESQDHVTLEIYDVRGRLVKRLIDQVIAAGTYEEIWDTRDDAGRKVPSGIYFARLRNSTHNATKKILIAN